MTSSHQRAHYLSQLEAVNNVAQTIGPFIGGILSSIQLKVAMYDYDSYYHLGGVHLVFIVLAFYWLFLLFQKVFQFY